MDGAGQIGAGYLLAVFDGAAAGRGKFLAVFLQQVAVGSIGGGGEYIEKGVKGVVQLQGGVVDAGAQFLKDAGGLGRGGGDFRVDRGVAEVGAVDEAHSEYAAVEAGAEIGGRLRH